MVIAWKPVAPNALSAISQRNDGIRRTDKIAPREDSSVSGSVAARVVSSARVSAIYLFLIGWSHTSASDRARILPFHTKSPQRVLVHLHAQTGPVGQGEATVAVRPARVGQRLRLLVMPGLELLEMGRLTDA